MKLTVEPAKLLRLLENSLVNESSTPLLDKTTLTFTSEGVKAVESSLNVIIVALNFQKSYFTSLEVDEKGEKIVFAKSLLDMLSKAFHQDKPIEVQTQDGKLTVTGTSEHYEEELLVANPEDLSSIVQVDDKLGIVPKALNPAFQAKIDSAILRSLPKAGAYLFTSKDSTLKVIISDIGEYTKTLTLKETPVTGAISILVDGDYFNHVIANLQGDIWFALHKHKSKKNSEGIFLSQQDDSTKLIYMITAKHQED